MAKAYDQERNPPYFSRAYWLNSPLSTARFWGACTYNGVGYEVDELTGTYAAKTWRWPGARPTRRPTWPPSGPSTWRRERCPMISQAQAKRDLLDIEHQLRHTRNRRAVYELLGDVELAAHTGQLVAHFELVKATLLSRSQDVESER